MAFKLIPWSAFEGNKTHFWVHYSLVILGFVVAIITLISQWFKPAPYGKHTNQNVSWGPNIPQRLGHISSDAIPGVLLFLLVFFLYGNQREAVNIVFLVLFELHYIHRGLIHPLLMRYSDRSVAIGISLAGFISNCLYHFINADWIGSANYDNNYYYDPRFIFGVVLFVTGYVVNRWADFTLRSLRKKRGEYSGYYIPYGGLFELITCPNYFGELIEWLGWGLATWSLAGLVWCLFSAATFIARSRHNHKWYQDQFENYPKNRKAFIPYIF